MADWNAQFQALASDFTAMRVVRWALETRWGRRLLFVGGVLFITSVVAIVNQAVWQFVFNDASDASLDTLEDLLGDKPLSPTERVDLILAYTGTTIQFGTRLQLAAALNIALSLAAIGFATALAKRRIESRGSSRKSPIRVVSFAVVAGVAVGTLLQTQWAVTGLPGNVFGGTLEGLEPLNRGQEIQLAVAKDLIEQARSTYELTIVVAAVPLLVAIGLSILALASSSSQRPIDKP